MSSAEFVRWIEYRQRNGAMDDRRTHDRPAALVATVVAKVFGGKAQMEDFMPYKQQQDEPTITDPKQLVGIFGKFKR